MNRIAKYITAGAMVLASCTPDASIPNTSATDNEYPKPESKRNTNSSRLYTEGPERFITKEGIIYTRPKLRLEKVTVPLGASKRADEVSTEEEFDKALEKRVAEGAKKE